MRKLIFMLISLPGALFCLLDACAAVPPRMYTNPLGGLRMGDPFVMRYKGAYYLYGTTAGDGFLGWRSTNLVDWEPLSYVYKKTGESWGGSTYWAPEVVFYNNKFYMVFSCEPANLKDFGARICLAVSDKPEGPFEDLHVPLFDPGYGCIDGHIYIDDGNMPYLFFDKVGVVGAPWMGPKFGHLFGIIYAVKLKDDLSGIAGEPVECLHADAEWELSFTPGQMPTRCNEGASVFKHKNRYYMTYSANHYASPDYGIGYATAFSPLGPWTKSSGNPLVRSDPAVGVSGPGHNCVVCSPNGKELFMVYHTHADPAHPSGERTVNIDRLVINKNGALRLIGPTRSPQPMPSAKRRSW
ncbi:MAG: glycoside hydrolase family 43 protein [Bacillota bacterium]